MLLEHLQHHSESATVSEEAIPSNKYTHNKNTVMSNLKQLPNFNSFGD